LNTTQQVNIVTPQFKANPFPYLARLRATQPVYRTTLPDKVKTPVWLMTRYEDVNTLLKDERFPKSRRSALTPEQLRKLPWVPPMFRPLERNMLDLGRAHPRGCGRYRINASDDCSDRICHRGAWRFLLIFISPAASGITNANQE